MTDRTHQERVAGQLRDWAATSESNIQIGSATIRMARAAAAVIEDLLGQPDTSWCAWCEEAQATAYLAHEGHDPGCPLQPPPRRLREGLTRTPTLCHFCHQPLDRRRICPARSSSARFPNGKRCRSTPDGD